VRVKGGAYLSTEGVIYLSVNVGPGGKTVFAMIVEQLSSTGDSKDDAVEGYRPPSDETV